MELDSKQVFKALYVLFWSLCFAQTLTKITTWLLTDWNAGLHNFDLMFAIADFNDTLHEPNTPIY